MSDTWEGRIGAFWRDAEGQDAARLWTRLEAILVERAATDPDALFERASLHDYLGEEDRAIPLYREALGGGLAGGARTEARIQLASSLRNVGEPSAALSVLRDIGADDPLADAAAAFRSLALYDDGKPAEALRLALRALAPHLPAYTRAVEAYAGELRQAERVRSIVVGLLVHDGHVLAEEYPPTAHHAGFLRMPGGGIEIGERAAEAIRREFAEELGATLDSATLRAVTENIFDAHGRRGHEIVHVFEVASRDLERLPIGDRLPVQDSDTFVAWHSVADLRRGNQPVYPDGVLDFLP
ncbi:tetratricopeptide repeat protein [Microbacterium sp. TNHR37B]|uniref:tetratricopeptide repeat protein n=1 Tax=Microbacterium sp. TNHR37B TaxID=1775956 RepID=UPI0007B18F56|nr:tetratricopeptide repeat protein [Microbacterium sp. TNHR37B]KZE90866.1 Nucleoside triphosphatase NudI [Microbacterium sp. TNHR37B]